MNQDRVELNDLARKKPEAFGRLKTKWDGWAERVNVLTPEEFETAKKR